MIALELTILDFVVVFFASGAVLAGLFGVQALLQKPTTAAQRWLALLLFAAASFLGSQLFNFGGFVSADPIFYYPPLRFTFLFGPALYFFVCSLLRPDWAWRRADWLHFLLPIGQAVLTLWLGFQSLAVKHYFWVNIDQAGYGLFDELWTAVSMLVYGAVAWRLVNQVEPTVAVAQARALIRILFVCATVALVVETAVPWLVMSVWGIHLFQYALYVSLPYLIYSVGLIMAAVYAVWAKWRPISPAEPERKERYGLDELATALWAKRVDGLLFGEQLYLDPELTLTMLARRLGIPAKQLSYVINESYGESFPEIVNRLRVEAAVALLIDPAQKKRPILDIGFEVGFRSKSTFNRIFRAQTGKTPSQVRAESQNPRPKTS